MIIREDTKTLKLLRGEIFYQVEAVLKQTSANICMLKIDLSDEVIEVEADDFFSCLCIIKDKHPNVLLYRKGYKVNVYPSRMAAQMSSGMVAYEMEMGRSAKRSDIVHTFDFEDSNLTASNKEQNDFYREWLNSFLSNNHE